MFRTGIGYDTHRLSTGRKLILGGIHIPYERGLMGHSDADVLLHAICDALLGAAGLGDIGRHFPDNVADFKDIASSRLLEAVMVQLHPDFSVINIDTVIIAAAPKLEPYKREIEEHILQLTQAEQVCVKATTTEGMNAEGEGRCISAQAVCLLQLKKPSIS